MSYAVTVAPCVVTVYRVMPGVMAYVVMAYVVTAYIYTWPIFCDPQRGKRAAVELS